MKTRSAIGVLCALLTSPVFAHDRLIPVVTGTVPGRAYSTTILVKNTNDSDAQCVFTYRGPERIARPLVSKETIPSGKTHIYEDFLSEIAAAGTVRVDCPSGVEVLARVQDSLDGAKTFRAGRLFRPFSFDDAIAAGGKRTIRAIADLVLAEVAGKSAHVEVVAANFGGVVYGKKSYDVPPYAQRVVALDSVLDRLEQTDVTVSVTSGEGRIAVGKETRDPALAKLARHRTAAEASVQVVTASSTISITEQLLLCPFKGASFRDPATGLCFFRDRWYDPRTGTFLTPDRAGYRDSSNLYIFGKGDPVNNNDPTGMYIDETRILNSPMKNRYVSWRNAYLQSPLGRQVWNQLDRIPAAVFTLEMNPMAGANGNYASGAETTNFFDATGAQNRAVIEFSPRFGGDPGSGPPLTTHYRHGLDVYHQDQGAFIQYAFGHEIGHVLGGWDPSIAPQARQFSNLGTQLDATITQFSALRQMKSRTPAQQQQYQQIAQQRNMWLQQQNALKNALEPYADDIGFQIYRSYRQTNPRWLWLSPVGGKNFNPSPQLPPGATSNIPTAVTP
jgi:RHS repeat-associated protein